LQHLLTTLAHRRQNCTDTKATKTLFTGKNNNNDDNYNNNNDIKQHSLRLHFAAHRQK